VEERLAAQGKAAAAVGHQAFALRRADRRAQIRLARQARFALAAFGRIQRDDVVAFLHRGDARADVHYDPRALVAEDGREQALGIAARAGEFVGVADPGRLQLDQDLARLGTVEVHGHDLQGFACGNGDGGFGFHASGPLVVGCRRGGGAAGCGIRRFYEPSARGAI
jgi:hypothetical protein